MKINFRFMTLAMSLILCLSAIAFGQRNSGNIDGTITDSAGAVVPGASVTVKSTGTTAGYNSTATTDSNGYFIFSQVPVGTYSISVSATNFKTVNGNVDVSLDRTSSFNRALEAGGGTTVIDVNADSNTTIDLGDTKIDNNINKDIIENLPTGTTFASVLKIAPNVRPEALSGGFQIDGASGSENVFVIDGQEVTNFRTGVLNSNNNLPFELLQEVQIKSTGYEAEYGGATGGVINVVTTGGNDTWRGNFGLSFTPAKLQGNPRGILTAYNAAGVANLPNNFTYFQPNKDGGTNFFPVASLSGPIVKEKFWFSLAYAPQLFNTIRTINYYSNTIAGNSNANPNGQIINNTLRYEQTLRQEQYFVRLDAQPTSKLRLFGTFVYNPLIQDGVLPATNEGLGGSPQSVNFGGSLGTLTGPALLGQQGGRQNANNINGQATYNATNNLVLNFRAGRSFLNEKLNSYGLPRTTRYICSQVSGGVTTAQTGCAQGFQNIANNNQINFDVSTRTTFDADASLVGINLGGRHNFKFGYQFNRLFNSVSNGYRDLGIIQLFYGRTVDVLSGAPLTPTPGNLGSGLLTRFGTVGEASSKSQAIFGQDSWQINNRLTLNLGIRFEKETVPNFGDAANSQAIEFGWSDKISPRLGFALDLFGDGKNKVFASYGWFYDRFKYELPRGSFGGDFFRRDFFEILPARGTLYTGYTLANILGSNPDPIGGTCPIVGGTGYSVCQFDFRVATNLIGANIFETGAVDPDLLAARQSEYTIGFERQLSQNFLLSARYTHKQLDRAIEDVGVFNSQGSEAYIIGNPGLGLVCEISQQANLPCAKAQRDYDAFEIRIDRRTSKYFFNASYTLSRLFGNYSGLASSDEAGRTSPNVNRFFDLPPLGFTADGDPDNGRLATDRPHVFKAYGGYTFDWWNSATNRTTVSAFTTIQSGTPLTTIYNLYSLGTTILNGRGDLGRTDKFTETDFSVNHRYKFGRDNRFTLEGFLDIRNLFNEDNAIGAQTNISATNFSATTLTAGGCATCTSEGAVFQTIFNGAGIRQNVLNYLAAQGTSTAGRLNTYGLPNAFQAPRDVRFGFRVYF
jgi:hypothetical protein